MYAQNYITKSNVIQLEPPPPEPAVGERVTFMHRNRLMVGTVWGTIHTVVQRHLIDGVHPVVCEYVIEPEAGQSPWKYVTVHESDVMWGYNGHRPIIVKCHKCNDLGYLSITGDDAQNCEVCNPYPGEVVC